MTFQDCQELTINGERLVGNEIVDFCSKHKEKNVQALGEFMSEWLRDSPRIQVKTSGSTGIPKLIGVEKNQMLASAAATAQFFGFEAGQTALLCLPMSYIAGKMMVVRALLSKLNLICIEPCNAPLSLLEKETAIDFVPLTPMQLKGTVDTHGIRKILLGGGAVSPDMEVFFQKLNAAIYLGYGMTETLSHVALRRLNGVEKTDIYHALPEVFFSWMKEIV
jgi:O-succinylbenzoic acid--CoA ligase